MKKILSLILIMVLSLTMLVSVVACTDNEGVDDGSGDVVNPPANNDGDSNPTPPPQDDGPEEVVIPRAEYTDETIDGVRYIYYGSMPQKAVSKDLNNVLQNLVESANLTPNEKGYYTYAGVDYVMVTGTEQTQGVRLSNGLNVEKDKNYFFTIDKLRWRVLEEKNGEAFLLCDSVIDRYCFNPTGSYSALGYLNGTSYNSHDFAVSALRTYMNDSIYNSIFTLREKQSILETTVLNRPGESAYWETQGLMTSSKDRLFALSYYELTKEEYGLVVDENYVMAAPVCDYKIASGMQANRVENSYYADWWLRTSGSHVNMGYRVLFSGVIGRDTQCSVNLDYACGVRPAMWLKI